MDAETLKLFRINLLIQARAASRMGLSVNEYIVGARAQGFAEATPKTVRDEIDYLVDKRHLMKFDSEISPGVESFRITASGRDSLEMREG